MKVFESASQIDQNTLNLQYLDALKTVASSGSTKIIIPVEMVRLFSGILKEKS